MPVEAFHPPIKIPDIDLWECLFQRKDRNYPDDHVIFIDPDTNRSYTYAQTRDAALEFGKGLRARFHWEKDDVLALFSPNSIDAPAVTFGCLWAGGIVSPANPLYTEKELSFQLKDSRAKALATQFAFLSTAIKAAKLVGLPEDRIILLGDQRDPNKKFRHFTRIRDVNGLTEYARPRIEPKNDIAYLVYSSGTTGLPKGVMLTHRNIVSNILQNGTAEFDRNMSWKGGPDGKGDKMLSFLPIFHIYGLTFVVHCCFYYGLPLLLLPKFELENFCQLIETHKVVYAPVVPPVVLLLSKHPIVAKYDLSSVKMMNSAAAPLTEDLINTLYERHKIPVKQAYGLSETSPGAAIQRREDWDKYPGSVGRLCSNMQLKIMSTDEETELPAGSEGEIWLKGPNIFKGYLNNPAGTANALTPDGYFKTGDIGYVDPHGNIYITDRVKELIKYKGFQVAPAELEGLLTSHPLVADAAVVGVYEPAQATELPRAYIVLTPGTAHTDEIAGDISKWVAGKVTGHKKLRGGVRFVDEIPKSATGKILRRILRDQAAAEVKDMEKGGAGVKSKL